MKIVIIGTGNVATVFGSLLKEAGHEILQVYGRNPDHASALAAKLGSVYCSEFDALPTDGELYIAAISDKSLMDMAEQLTVPARIIVHTAGAVPARVLSTVSENYGVIYP